MPMIWGYSYAADDYIEMEWVEDADWDQEAWDEWDRLRDTLCRMTPTPAPTLHDCIVHRREWRNMVDGGAPAPSRPRF